MLFKVFNRLAGIGGYALMRKARCAELRRLENYKPSGALFSEHLRQLFQRLKVTCVLDVGANDGGYAESLRREVGYEGWIHSFEPLPDLHDELKRKAANDPRWIIHSCALGAASGEAELNVMASTVFSSFLAPDPGQPVKYAESNRVKNTVRVPVRTVAEVLPGILEKCGGPVYLKTDTQGYDLQVFKGAKEVLSHIVALQSELSFRAIYEGAPGWQALVSAFGDEGFRPSFFLPISFDDGLAILEADGVFTRSPSAAAAVETEAR